jgi:multidrug resistance efflux pump
MPTAFSQTLSDLAADQRRRSWMLAGFVVVGVLLGAWIAWFMLARVPVYAVSDTARIQASAEIHPVDVLISGRVAAVHLPLGGLVRAGQPLLELDTSDVRLRLDAARAEKSGLQAQIAALEAELVAREQALAETASVGRVSVSEAAALRKESESLAGLAAREQERTEKLHAVGVVPEAEFDRGQTRRELAERRAENASLERVLAGLRANLEAAVVNVRRLEEELDRHTVRAPVAGRLGNVRAPQVGSVVQVGQSVAVVAPEGALEIMADFPPSEAVGRIRVGQPARMRVSGFLWTQYGVLTAQVSAISSEVTDGRIRVELALSPDPNSAIPLNHGLTGTVEIELEEISPAVLTLRSAGQLLARESPAP